MRPVLKSGMLSKTPESLANSVGAQSTQIRGQLHSTVCRGASYKEEKQPRCMR